MIKKIFLITLLSCVAISCGKKGDPIYKDSKKSIEVQIIIIDRA
tara:strand:- start:376 stop:507 length:132 start_codon:yes stop_codon:yes gene_type:complete